MNDMHDEISLRDLYLIVKRGIPLILGVTLLAALAAFLFVSLQSASYEAQAAVFISPTPVRIEGAEDARNLVLDQRYEMSWEAYQEIAFSPAVLDRAVTTLDGSFDLTSSELRARGKLTRLGNSQASLTVTHSVSDTNPERAAAAATAWATATEEAVSEVMTAGLDAVTSRTERQLQSLQERVASAARNWEEFHANDESALLDARLEGLAQRIPRVEAKIEELARETAATQAARQTLAASREGGTANDSEAQAAVALLEGQGQLPEETIAELTALLQRREGEVELVSLIRQVELQRLTARQAGLMAERERAEEQLEQLRRQAAELRADRAGRVLERERLQQQLDLARTSYGEVASLAPVIDYIRQLVAANNRVLGSASVPSDSAGPRPLLVSVLVAVVAGMLALLFVFLRAAVSEPQAPRPVPEQARPSPTH